MIDFFKPEDFYGEGGCGSPTAPLAYGCAKLANAKLNREGMAVYGAKGGYTENHWACDTHTALIINIKPIHSPLQKIKYDLEHEITRDKGPVITSDQIQWMISELERLGVK